MCACTSECVSVWYTSVCVCAHVHVYICVCVWCLSVCVFMCMYIFVCMWMYIGMHICVCAYHVHVHICVCVCKSVCEDMYAFMCMHVETSDPYSVFSLVTLYLLFKTGSLTESVVC